MRVDKSMWVTDRTLDLVTERDNGRFQLRPSHLKQIEEVSAE